MTLGEKIIHLRIVNKISQTQLAKFLSISRQTISKWESNEVEPQLDNIIKLSELFKVTTDELINKNIVIQSNKTTESDKENTKPKLFGTDGFRGEANEMLTGFKAYKIGRFLGWFYSNPKYNMQPIGYRPRVVIGKDTRRSSYMLEYGVAAGLSASGADVCLLHVTTTPSVSYVVRKDNFDCGVMITASHNVFYDNGIKVINGDGEKLDDSVALLIEAYLDGNLEKLDIKEDDLPYAKKDNIGTITDYVMGRNQYVAYLISLAKHSFKSLKIGLDTSNGSSYLIAKNVFDALGAHTYIINNEPDGTNINLEAGSTHISYLVDFVKKNKLDLGFAFDGDADRCIAVDEKGNVVDGDKIIYILGKKLKSEGALTDDTVVTTIMSNKGLDKALKAAGIKNVQTKVGDRYVYEKMLRLGLDIGGEQSGHIILRKYATTGDGILTAIMITEEVLSKKAPLSKLAAPVKLYPQKLKNVKVIDKVTAVNDEAVVKKLEEIKKDIKDNGRILLRESGTEPVVRIMVEADSFEECDAYIGKMYNVFKKRGLICE